MASEIPVSDDLPDGAVIAASLNHPDSFATVFDRHYPAVHRYLARRTLTGQAEDLSSLTFVVAFERRRSFRLTATSALPWLLGIATNLLRERLRGERRELGTLNRLRDERAPAPDGAWPVEENEFYGQLLAEALGRLDAPHREVLLLHAWEELSYQEIAQALDLPLGTVRSRLHRARRQLRAHLEVLTAIPRSDPHQETT
jgi:RNA polymerase sigma factor (sigma-70 family)